VHEFSMLWHTIYAWCVVFSVLMLFLYYYIVKAVLYMQSLHIFMKLCYNDNDNIISFVTEKMFGKNMINQV
jgi:hypothetical protein